MGEQEVPVGDEMREAVTVGVAKLTSGSADLVGSTLLKSVPKTLPYTQRNIHYVLLECWVSVLTLQLLLRLLPVV